MYFASSGIVDKMQESLKSDFNRSSKKKKNVGVQLQYF